MCLSGRDGIIFNHEWRSGMNFSTQCTVQKSGVGKFMVEKSGVEMSFNRSQSLEKNLLLLVRTLYETKYHFLKKKCDKPQKNVSFRSVI